MKQLFTIARGGFVMLLLMLFAVNGTTYSQTPSYYTQNPTSGSNAFPFNTAASNRCQYVFPAGSFQTGIIAGNVNKIYVKSVENAFYPNYTNFTVRMGMSNITQFASGSWYDTTLMQTVFYSPSHTITQPIFTDTWVEIPLQVPFQYDGTSSIILEISSTAYANGFNTRTVTATNSRNAGGVNAATPTTSNLGIAFGLNILPAIPNNAGINEILTPLNFCPGTHSINIEIANNGNNIINSVDVHWSLNGVPQTTYNHLVPIDTFGSVSGHTAAINLGNYNFTSAPVQLTAYTSNPNNLTDIVNSDDTLHMTLQASLSGVYTINSNLPTGGSNYASFADFTNDLDNFGICGPVVANVDPASGPYNEVVRFGNISGSSPTNTIRVNGNGRTVQYTNTTTAANNDRQMLVLNGTKYLTIDNLVVKTLGTAGWGALITAGSLKDSIINCTFDMTSITSTTSANSSGIVFSGSFTTATTTGGSNSKHCYIGGNTVIGPTGTGGPYYGVCVAGADSNTVENNEFLNFYHTGIYISVSRACNILDNDIHRSTKTAVTTFYGIATNTGATHNTIISGNRIHTPGGVAATATAAAYGMDISGDGDAASPVLVSNNVVYDMNQGGSTNVLYGIQIDGALYNKVYHNTVTLDRILTGTGANRGIFATNTNTGTEIKNNIISITGGTQGVKTGIFYNVAASIDVVNAQRNNVYVNSTQTGNQFHFTYPSTSTFATLANYQNTHPTSEVGSENQDPLFANAAAGDFMPTNQLLASNGLDLTADVPEDINGIPRSAAPTPGAFEIAAVQGVDGAVVSVLSPSSLFCADDQEVRVSIANYGTASISNFPIHWQLNGVSQPVYNYLGTLDPLAGPGQSSDTITIGIANFVVGNNNLKVWVDINNDQNALNDTLLATLVPTAFTISAANDSICISGDVDLTLSPAGSYPTGSISWENSVNGVNYAPIPGAGASTYSEPATTADNFYRAFINLGVNGCFTNQIAMTVLDPQVVSTQDGERCGTGSVNLSGVATPGASLTWYANPSGGAPLGTGNTFATPSISNTTNFYVSAGVGGGATEDVPSPNVGTSTFITTTAGWGLHFTVNSQTTIASVDMYPVNTTAPGSAATLQVRITNISDVLLYQGPVYNFTASGTPTQHTVPVDITLPPGIYKMVMTYSGINNLVRESTGVTYPYTPPSNSLSITAGANGAGSAQATTAYYWFYNWKLGGGCESPRVPVEAVVLPAPSAQIFPGGQTYFCEDDSLALGVVPQPGDIYQWYFNGNPISNSDDNVYMATQTGDYTVDITNTFNCTATSVPASAIEVITTATVTPAGATTFCLGNNVNLQANTGSGYTYQWLFNGANVPAGGNTSNYTANATGNYSVITTINGCSEESSPVAVTVNPLPPASITPSNVYICDGSATILTANTGAGFTYQWLESGLPINGATSGTYNATDAGNYSVWVTNANTCSSLSADAIVTLHSSPSPVINQNGLVLSTTIYSSYQWNLNGAPIQGATSQQYTVSESGSYTVTVTDPNGCSTTSSMVNMANVSVSEYDALEISVFPNPASNLVQIVAPHSVDVELVAMNGQVVLRQNNANMIDISALADDIYLLRIMNAEGKLIGIRKIVKISK